ncbi:response regulator transcription factor [Nocardia sp. alder85J]|uniref:response regulator transcription factor n=1 Tax=Nocardia sp. alder85J TaxID=2862949 RepID=UPI001CD46B2A|nr:response regulator transcription factor [Nocardia sp. alder85J]MCX4092044.1 response regulator transcription factor [Nocardia sp. alder85J]
MTTRVLLVDDQQLVRAGLRMLCDSAGDLEVVGEAGGGADGVRLARRLRPDVVLMDLRMPGMDGIRCTAQILAADPAARVLVLTTFDDDEHLYPALAAGACGFLVKDASPAELLDGIRRAAAGQRPFSAPVLGRVVDSAVAARTAAPPPEPAPLPPLTGRESEVLHLISQGLSNAEIAARLHVGITTVKTHVAGLLAKTGAANRVRLALLALGHSPETPSNRPIP